MTSVFWRACGIRAIKTFCEACIASISTATVMHDVNWVMVLSASLLAAIISMLSNIAIGLPEVPLVQPTDNKDKEENT